MNALGRVGDVLKIAAVALVYAVLAKIVLAFFSNEGNVTLVWFPGGLGLAAILLGGNKYGLGVFLGAFSAGLMVGDSPWVSAAIALGNTLESWLGAWLLLRKTAFSLHLRHPRDFGWLALVGIAVSCVSALIGPLVLLVIGVLTPAIFPESLLHWWMADVFGIALVTPLLLIWRKWPQSWFVWRRLPETLTFFALSFLSGQIIFLDWFHSVLSISVLGYWAFLFVVWAAVRFGRHGISAYIILTAIQALWGLQHRQGLFASEQLQQGLLNLWFYLLTLAAVGIPLALVLYERDLSTQALQRSKQLMKFALESVHTGGWDLDLTDFSAERTLTHAHIFGYETLEDEWSFQKFLGHVIVEDRERVEGIVRKAIEDQAPLDFECRIRRLDGNVRLIRVAGCHQLERRKAGRRMAGIVQDITDTKRAEEIRQLAMLFYENCSEGMMVTETDGTIISVNPAFTRITGYGAEDVIGRNANILSSGRHDKHFYQTMWQSILATGQWRGEMWNRRKDGQLYVDQMTIDTIFAPDGNAVRRIGLFSDITPRKMAEEQLWKQANFDALTGVTNRRMFYERLEQEFDKARRDGGALALLLLDIDRLKDVNARLAYSEADIVLRDAVQRMLACVSENDGVARIAGDEFAIILGHVDRIETVEAVVSRIRTALVEPFRIGRESIRISCSIGIALYPDDADNPLDMQRAADRALYAVKSQGGNGYRFVNPKKSI